MGIAVFPLRDGFVISTGYLMGLKCLRENCEFARCPPQTGLGVPQVPDFLSTFGGYARLMRLSLKKGAWSFSIFSILGYGLSSFSFGFCFVVRTGMSVTEGTGHVGNTFRQS